MRWAAWVGWTLFAILLLAAGQQFLYACGLHIGPFVWNACPAPPDIKALTAEARTGQELQRQIHEAEMDLARKPPCQQVPRPARVEEDPRKKIARALGAKRGKLELFLSWNTLDDLDLVIGCPGGKIGGFRGRGVGPVPPRPRICGDGHIDVDANKNLTENVTDAPVEHAVWENDVPEGTYDFRVQRYRSKGNKERSIDFKLEMVLDGREKVCAGSVPFFPKSDARKTPEGKILGSFTQVLTWHTGQPLPDCNWSREEAYYCDRDRDCPKP